MGTEGWLLDDLFKTSNFNSSVQMKIYFKPKTNEPKK